MLEPPGSPVQETGTAVVATCVAGSSVTLGVTSLRTTEMPVTSLVLTMIVSVYVPVVGDGVGVGEGPDVEVDVGVGVGEADGDPAAAATGFMTMVVSVVGRTGEGGAVQDTVTVTCL